MRALFLFVAALSVHGAISAQDTCNCPRTFLPRYPDKAEKAGVCGTVVVEIRQSAEGTLSGPVVIQGIGYGCDEEALRVIRLQIGFFNSCRSRCGALLPAMRAS